MGGSRGYSGVHVSYFFNRADWQQFNASLSHRHVYDSACGFMAVGSTHDGAVLLRCKCGQSQWFFPSMSP